MQSKSLFSTTEMQPTSQSIKKQFDVIEKIGSGGMSNVYRAAQRDLQRIVALKVCKSPASSGNAISHHFAREAQIISSVRHHNIAYALVAAIDTELDRAYYAMEFIDGPNLEEVLLANERVSERSTLEMALELSSALECLHSNNIIHLDIKPANIVYTRMGLLKLIDFGIARSIKHSYKPRKTEGTPFYMAPEQARTITDELDGRTDLYALGCMLYQVLTGQLPYTGKSNPEIAAAHVQGKVPRIRQLVPEISPATDELVFRLMQRQKADRPMSAVDLQSQLQKSLANLSVVSEPPLKSPIRKLRFRRRYLPWRQ